MTKLWILLVLFILSTTIVAQGGKYTVEGTISRDYDNKPIMLFTFSNDSILSADTTIVRNGTFRFEGGEYQDEFSLLSIGNYPEKVRYAELILEKGVINIELDSLGLPAGTPLNDLYRNYYLNTRQYGRVLRRLRVEQGDRFIRRGSPYQKAFIELGNYTTNFKKENVSNIVGRRIFLEGLGGSIAEAVCGEDSTFQVVYDVLDDEMKKHPAVLTYQKDRAEDKVREAQRNEAIGKPYTDFEMQTPEGERKKISDYIGKSQYLLIDFWASWCGPCIADMPRLKEAYQKYKDKGLMILSVSLDDNKRAWLKAIERIDVPWSHLCVPEETSDLKKAYYVKSIPYGVLVDKEGKIIVSSIKGSNLDFVMDYVFNKKP